MWFWIAVQLVAALVIYAAQPRPKRPEPQKANVPVAEDGREIVVIFGDRWVGDANMLAWKEIGTVPIKSDGKK